MIIWPFCICVIAAMPDWVSSAYTSRCTLPLGSLHSSPRASPAADAARVNAAVAAIATAFLVNIVVSIVSLVWVIDRRALEYSPYAIERTTAAARKQLLKFVEDDDEIAGPRSLSKSS